MAIVRGAIEQAVVLSRANRMGDVRIVPTASIDTRRFGNDFATHGSP
jgi:hypothetical protein